MTHKSHFICVEGNTSHTKLFRCKSKLKISSVSGVMSILYQAWSPLRPLLHTAFSLLHIRCYDNTRIKALMQNHMGFRGFATSHVDPKLQVDLCKPLLSCQSWCGKDGNCLQQNPQQLNSWSGIVIQSGKERVWFFSALHSTIHIVGLMNRFALCHAVFLFFSYYKQIRLSLFKWAN